MRWTKRQWEGLSDSTIERFKLGFDPNYTRGTGGKSWEAVIIPLTSSIYIARNTDEKAVKKKPIQENRG